MLVAEPLVSSWKSHLALEFDRRDRKTVLAGKSHVGPLVVQKPLYPEGEAVCHAIVVHPPGGVVGGDELDIRVAADRGAHALLTTPGAAKWYRSSGATASQQVRLRARSGAAIEWLPQEAVVFNGAAARWSVDAEADASATIVGLEVVMLGRAARGEQFTRGELRFRTRLVRDGAPAFVEQWRLAGGDPRLAGPQGLGSAPCFGTLWAIGDPDRLTPALAAVRAVLDRDASATLLPAGVLLARAVGDGPEAVRGKLERAWRALRPVVLGVAAERPRIWNT